MSTLFVLLKRWSLQKIKFTPKYINHYSFIEDFHYQVVSLGVNKWQTSVLV